MQYPSRQANAVPGISVLARAGGEPRRMEGYCKILSRYRRRTSHSNRYGAGDGRPDENGVSIYVRAPLLSYSCRKATRGSILEAKCAGRKAASRATTPMRTETQIKTAGSIGLTPYNWLAI